MPPKN